ncbi:hypothetical protein PIB30_043996 [Stylosanthes scabra]|uniref:Tudor domain-containing protein n=1 Tax=Stylosanthes scabra TaxID=79078 RepID=A0ABU6VGR1_9FABA|nr:hypothetical protein [Stylosanthes scabra]
MALSEKELEEKLLETGGKLVDPPSSVAELLPLLDQVEGFLSEVEQSPPNTMQSAINPSMKALIAEELVRHSDADVKVAVASCISEITRITAPEAPYDDDQMKEVFRLIVSSFENLHDKSSRSYAKRASILETVAKVRSCVVMLDLECDALILEMFQHFLKEIRESHPENVFSSMETIMILVLDESEDISVDLISPLLFSIKKDNEEVLPIARKLGERVLESCATKLKPYLVQAVRSLGISIEDYGSVLASICQDACDGIEPNDLCATSEHVEDKNKSEKQAQEESKHVATEDAMEAAPSQQNKPAGDGSPKSIMSNGIAQVGHDDTPADPKSVKKQEDVNCSDQSKDANISVHNLPNDLDTEKVDTSDQKQEQATQREVRKPSSSTKVTESSDVQDVTSEKEAVEKLGAESHSKNTSTSPHENHSVEAADHSENDKEINVDTEKVDSSERKQEQATERQGSKTSPSTKLIKSFEAQAIATEKEHDLESQGKEFPQENSVEEGPSEGEKMIHLDFEKVDGSEQKNEASQEQGRKPSPSTKLTKPFQAIANDKEAEEEIHSESHSKKVPCSPQEDHSVEAEGPSENDKEIELGVEKVDNSLREQEQDTNSQGRKHSPLTKLTESSEVQTIANEKEAKKELDSESHSKEVPSSPKDNHSVEAEGPSEKDKVLGTEKVDKSQQKHEQATKKRGGEPSSSNKLTEVSEVQAVANKTEAQKELDSESHKKESTSSHENHSVEAAGPLENEKKIYLKISLPKKVGSNESEAAATFPSNDSLHDENRPKKIGQVKTKDGVKEKGPEKDHAKKLLDGTSDSETKPARQSVKKAVGKPVKKTPGSDSVKKGSRVTSDSDAKKHSAKKVDQTDKVGDGSSSRQREQKKKLGRGEAKTETVVVKDADKEMVSSTRSVAKSNKDEASEETPKTKVKRKLTPEKENESDTKEYGENLVGLRVEVWWPDDNQFYKGIIDSFDSAEKKHKVMYDDGDEEILNLRTEKWNIIEVDSDTNQEGGGNHASPDASADMPPKKKRKASAGEPIKQGKIGASSKSAGVAASSASKFSHKLKDGSKSKDSKTTNKFKDEVSRKANTKSGDNKSDTAAQKSASKSKDAGITKKSKPKSNDKKETPKTGKPKQDTTKMSKSKGNDKQETQKTGKSKQETPKTPVSGGKSNDNSSRKAKYGLLKRKLLESENSDDSEGEKKDTKGKTTSSSKAQGSEAKGGKKRRRT